jgi:hypothetical protein
LIELLQHIVKKGWSVLCILCRWAVAVKNTILTSKKSQKSAWNEDGDSHQDSTSVSSETPGAHKTYEDKIREAGW